MTDKLLREAWSPTYSALRDPYQPSRLANGAKHSIRSFDLSPLHPLPGTTRSSGYGAHIAANNSLLRADVVVRTAYGRPGEADE